MSDYVVRSTNESGRQSIRRALLDRGLAILTNAASVLIMSTSNRLARAVDRARELSKQLEAAGDIPSPQTDRRLRELTAAEDRALLLLQALRRYYTALGGFAAATLLSLLGAGIGPIERDVVLPVLEVLAAVTGVFAVGALVSGSIVLVRETRIAVQTLQDRAAGIRTRVAAHGASTLAALEPPNPCERDLPRK